MSWGSSMVMASFRGFEFHVMRTQDGLGRRRAVYEYALRDGADVEDRGRRPRPTSATAVFFGATYEEELTAFMAVVDEGEIGLFVHPVFGQWQAHVSIESIEHSTDERDHAVVQLDILEDGTNTEVEEIVSIPALIAEVNSDADEALAASSTDEVKDAASSAKSFAAGVQAAASKATGTVNQVRKKIDNALAAADDLTDLQSYPLVRALKRLSYSCQRLADRAQRTKPQIVEKEVLASVPLSLIAHRIYGDASRADELMILNQIRNPFIVKRDTKLRAQGS